MKTLSKTMKKIRKAVDKNADVRQCLTHHDETDLRFHVGPKNKAAFRFFRDQLEGDWASRVNHVYGTGGSMDVHCTEQTLELVLYDEQNRIVDRIAIEACLVVA